MDPMVEIDTCILKYNNTIYFTKNKFNKKYIIKKYILKIYI